MENLFQEFLFATISRSPWFAGSRVDRQSGSKILLRRGTGVTGDIHTKPDIRVSKLKNLLVVDAKYKEPLTAWMGRRIPVTPDVYQMIAYCVANSCPGALVYPKTAATEDDMNEIYEVHGSAIEFKLKTLDLSVSVSGLKSVCNSLCEDLSGIARKQDHVRTDGTTRSPGASLS
jgi:5-methylcytosine-specific restriction endonuclease McrBC regulatory subunit McrC